MALFATASGMDQDLACHPTVATVVASVAAAAHLAGLLAVKRPFSSGTRAHVPPR